ncbi:ABC transporter substrate-binding protein, partial [Staphylococcus pseudintermedius]|uniref:ABC transporter substrate-binding protein n=2 Tax=Bacillales TaxID=1385 RepID=UPI003F9B001C
KAAELLKRYDQFLSTYKGIANQIDEKATVYWEWWPKPVFTPGKANWLTEISELAGGENIFADHKEANVQSDWEEVLKRNPLHVC